MAAGFYILTAGLGTKRHGPRFYIFLVLVFDGHLPYLYRKPYTHENPI